MIELVAYTCFKDHQLIWLQYSFKCVGTKGTKDHSQASKDTTGYQGWLVHEEIICTKLAREIFSSSKI